MENYSTFWKNNESYLLENVDELGGQYASKISQTPKDKYFMLSPICQI